MTGFKKPVLVFFIFNIFLFIFFSKTFAQVVINEFSSSSDPEWIEIYNTNEETINLTGWTLEDRAQKSFIYLDGCVPAKGFRKFEKTNWLNNGGDDILLKNDQKETIDSLTYGDDNLVESPGEIQSAGRNPDGGDLWEIFDNPSPQNDSCVLSTPTPSPSLTDPPTPTPQVTPAGEQATLTPESKEDNTTPSGWVYVNQPKDKNGETIEGKNIKIYVDGAWIHHYVPWNIEFCDNCDCDGYANCGLGDHAISLAHSEFKDWQEEVSIQSGSSISLNPTLETVSETDTSPTSTPTPQVTPAGDQATPTPTPQVTPVGEQITPTPADSSTGSAKIKLSLPKILGQSTAPASLSSSSASLLTNSQPMLPLTISFFGLGLVSFASWPWLKKHQIFKKLLESLKAALT